MQRLYNQITEGIFDDDDWFENLPFRGGMPVEDYVMKRNRELSTTMIEFIIQNNASKRFNFSTISDFSWRHGKPRNNALNEDEATSKRKSIATSSIGGKRDFNLDYLDSFAPRRKRAKNGKFLKTNLIS
jgi:hypothetical protein